MWSELSARLAQLREAGLYRRRRLIEGRQDLGPLCDGRTRIDFSSNDYLGLARHPALVSAFQRGAERWGVGSGAAHLVSGHCAAHHALEEELAEFLGRDRALLFSTGYMANLGVISALVGSGDRVLEDRLNHASLLDGGLLSGARFQRYGHADIEALREALAAGGPGRTLVVSDGVFSMDGDLAPLPELAEAAHAAGAFLMIDDAHGLGVLGGGGRGTVAHFGLGARQVPILVGTLGKAFGTFGAFVAGSADLIEFLIQRARPYVYTTALPPAVAEATRAALCLVRKESWRRDKLQRLIARFCAGAEQLGLPLSGSTTPIQPIILGDSERAMTAGQALFEAGYWVGAIRPPAVPQGTARLRITFSADHEERQIDGLLDALSGLAREWR